MKSLILAEKPSVAREIARVLGLKDHHKSYIEGEKYIVTWALGHLVELKMPEHYNPKYKTWRLEDLPIIPEKMDIKVMKQTRHQFRSIEQLTKRKDIKDFIIATDAGREGELVARWILEKLHFRKPVKRLWISSVTDRAIRDGFNNLRPGKDYENLYHSAVCRAEADWLIGLNVSRALTTKYKDPLSAGRVQTPTLALIIEREKQIQKFVPTKFWSILAQLNTFEATWEKHGEKRIYSKEEAEQIAKKLNGQKAQVKEMIKVEKTEPQPLPYDLNELQREANKRFSYSAKKTLTILQRLYEEHKLITYPRTDSRYLTTDMADTMSERLQAVASAYNKEVQPILQKRGKVYARQVFNNNKVTDHHAIIPTEEKVHFENLTAEEQKIYDLIVRRFLTMFLPPYKYETIHITLEACGETLTARTKNVTDLGFKKVLHLNEEIIDNKKFQQIMKGKIFTIKQVHSVEKFTEPPQRLTEADILGQMEKYGLGTPATRAEIIEKLVSSESVERKHGRFYSTQKGKQLIDLVNEELKSPKLTAKWEKELELIARGKAKPEVFLKKIRQKTKALVAEIKQSDKTYRTPNLTGSKCPDCGSFLKEKNTRDGKILICSNLECSYKRRKDPKLSNRRCPQCHKRMEIHQGVAGAYFQCRRCNIVEKAEEKQKLVNKREERKLIQKYTKKDNTFGTSLGDLLKAVLQEKE